MREIRLSGSEGGVALIAPSLPLSHDDCHVPAEAKMHGANASPELTAASNDFEEANHS
jgi:hypothetical protein